MKIVVENIFMCLIIFWKCYFPTNFSHFLSIKTNFFYRKFQNHSQILIHWTNHSQIPMPHTTETPIQPTTVNFGNQKPHHQNTTTTPPQQQQKSKSHRNQNHIERDWWVEDSWVEGEIAQRWDWAEARSKARSSNAVRSTRCCDRWDWCDFVREIVGLELGVRRLRRMRDLGSLFFLSLSLSLETIWSENRNENEFQCSKHLFYGQMKMISGKFYFQNQPNSLFYGKWFLETIYTQNKRTLNLSWLDWKKFNSTHHKGPNQLTWIKLDRIGLMSWTVKNKK